MRRPFLLAALALVFALSLAVAQTGAPFEAGKLAAAQASGKPLLVEVHADWCPTCAKQKPVLTELLKQPQFKDYQVLTVDFDKQKDVLRTLGVHQQSTLIVYRGKEEKGRSTGETSRERIAALLQRAI